MKHIDINDPIALEARIDYLRRQWKQETLNPRKQQWRFDQIKRQGLWAVSMLKRINSRIAADCCVTV